MKTRHLVFFFVVFSHFCVFSQENQQVQNINGQTYDETDITSSDKKLKPHSIYVELGGNSIFYSLNYDYLFSLSENGKLAVGAGLEYLTMGSYDNSYAPLSKSFLLVTPAVNLLLGKKSHHLEVGMSAIYFSIPSARIGYRYQPAKGGFLFRIGYTPIILAMPLHWGGLSFGYTF